MKTTYFLTIFVGGAALLKAEPPQSAHSETRTNEVISAHGWSGFQPLKFSAKELEMERKKAEERLQSVLAKDESEGINKEVREKEQSLRAVSKKLKKGMSTNDTLVIIGVPDVIQVVKTGTESGGKRVEISRVNTIMEVPGDASFVISYWPRVGVSFDGKNGQGYEVLYLLFNNQGVLERWFWEQPAPVLSGSLRDRMEQQKYWEGKHEKSTPPPSNFHW